jgi:hypothetical protein
VVVAGVDFAALIVSSEPRPSFLEVAKAFAELLGCKQVAPIARV